MAAAVVLIILIVCAYAWWSLSRRAVKVAASTPTLTGCWPVIGHTHKLIRTQDNVGLFQFVKDISIETNENGGVMKGWFGPALFYGLMELKGAHLSTNTSNFDYGANTEPRKKYQLLAQGTDECRKCLTERRPVTTSLDLRKRDYKADAFVITDPEEALTVLNTCLKKHYYYRFYEPFIGEGDFTARSITKWKRHRKLLIPAFNQQILDGFMDVFNQQARCLADKMAAELYNGPFDHWPYLAVNFLESICRTALGVPEFGKDLVSKEYGKACQDMLSLVVKRITRVWLHWDLTYECSSLKTEQDAIAKVFHKMTNDVIEKTKLRIKEKQGQNQLKNGRFKAFMDLLLELGAEGALTDQEIREKVDTMIIAGHDSSSTTLLYTLILLGSHSDVQARVYDELITVFHGLDRDVTKEDLPKLVLTQAVLKESLRLYPVAPLISRYADKDVKLKNCTIAAGSTIIASFWGMHRNERIWGADVNEFRPERWLEGGQSLNAAFGAFSLGRRGCIGKSYAFMAMKTTLVHLLRRYRFSSRHDNLVLKLDTVLKIHSGGKVAIELR